MELTCPECRARVAADQRYCLDCGHRVGELRLDWRALLHARIAPPAPAATRLVAGGVALPTPRIAATLLLIVMGFGVVAAGAAGPSVPRALATAARGPLTIVLPPGVAPPPAEPAPAAAPEPTPEPAVEPAAVPVSEPAPVAPANPAPEDDDETITGGEDETAVDVPPIRHVFLISLGPGTYEQWFGETSAVPYLRELAGQGTLLAGYEATAQSELSNTIALISGQEPTEQTEAGCPVYGDGCVFSLDTYTLPDQLVAVGSSWKAYLEGEDATPCRHPEYGQADPAPNARNPFVYFQTITTAPDCTTTDIGLTTLDSDLADRQATPTFSWITPNAENGTPLAPVPQPGRTPAPPAAELWLRTVVPKILASKAYKQGGLIAIVPDASGVPDDTVTGALLLSKYAPEGSIATGTFDHLSMLKGIENLFALRYLPGADGKEVKSFVSLLLH